MFQLLFSYRDRPSLSLKTRQFNTIDEVESYVFGESSELYFQTSEGEVPVSLANTDSLIIVQFDDDNHLVEKREYMLKEDGNIRLLRTFADKSTSVQELAWGKRKIVYQQPKPVDPVVPVVEKKEEPVIEKPYPPLIMVKEEPIERTQAEVDPVIPVIQNEVKPELVITKSPAIVKEDIPDQTEKTQPEVDPIVPIIKRETVTEKTEPKEQTIMADENRPIEVEVLPKVDPVATPPSTSTALTVADNKMQRKFVGWREKWIDFDNRESSWMNGIIEKRATRDKLLAEISDTLDKENDLLTKFKADKLDLDV